MEYAVSVQNLTKRYDGFALEGVSFHLPGGTILGVIGENGAGKSTLIKCLLGATRPEEGEVSLPQEVGYVPDECPFADMLTVRQVESFLAGMFPTWDKALFARYLDKFGLPREKKVKELSRGMKMKLSIAAALSHRPRLLVLDEATSGLDPVVRDEILDEFLDFISDGERAILVSSHITSDLEKICDYVLYLHRGRVTISGAKDELLAQYGKLSCTKGELAAIDPALIVGKRVGEYGARALIRDRAAFRRAHPELPLDTPTLEDLMIFTAKGERE